MNKKLIAQSFHEVFTRPGNIVIALIFAATVALGTLWLSNFRLIWFMFTTDIFSFSAKLKILWTSLGIFNTNFTFVSQLMIVIVSVLAGINFAMLVFYLKKTLAIRRAAGASALGLIVGTLGVGCSACGSVVLSSLFGITTATAFTSSLPVRGAEFGLASIAFILTSLFIIAKKISSPEVCSTNK